MLGVHFTQPSEEDRDSLKDYPEELSNNKLDLGCFYILFIFAT